MFSSQRKKKNELLLFNLIFFVVTYIHTFLKLCLFKKKKKEIEFEFIEKRVFKLGKEI